MAAKRITFGEDEEKRMSNALRMAFGSVIAGTQKEAAPSASVVESVPYPEGDDDQAREEYEKRVIMESVNRARERSGLKRKGVSKTPPMQSAANAAPSGFVVVPFDVFREKIGLAEKIVFLYLFSIAKDGMSAASLRQITENTGIGKTSVCGALNTLRKAGWLNWDTVRSGKTRQNGYSILRWRTTPLCSEYEQCSEIGQCSEYEQCSECGQCSENGQCSESGQCSDCEQCEKSLGITESAEHCSESEQCSESGQCSESEQCSECEQRRKIVGTTEFRQDLVRILREVKSRDLKDLDLKILKDLKDKKNKISDFVDNLCITHVDNSLVPLYLMTMFRIAFPEQSTEGLQVVKKLTERLQVGFAWYVVLLFIIKSSPYLMGKDKNSNGWKCTLTWALAADNHQNVMELKYVKYGLRWTPSNFIEYICRALEKGEY